MLFCCQQIVFRESVLPVQNTIAQLTPEIKQGKILNRLDVRQSKITKGPVLAGLGGKGLRRRDGLIGPVNPFPPRGSPFTSKIIWR